MFKEMLQLKTAAGRSEERKHAFQSMSGPEELVGIASTNILHKYTRVCVLLVASILELEVWWENLLEKRHCNLRQVPATYAIICYRQCSLTRAVSCRAWKCLLRREGETRHVAALGDEGYYLLTYGCGGAGRNEGNPGHVCAASSTIQMCAPHVVS